MKEHPSIWRAAAYLVVKHGPAAIRVAQRHAAEAPETETGEQRLMWMRVANAASELLRTDRKKDDQVH
jgi:hypothetical protein